MVPESGRSVKRMPEFSVTNIEGRLHALEREEKVDALLAELKQRKRLSP